MTSVYEFQVRAACPVDAAVVTFDVQVVTDAMIKVEDLLSHADGLTACPIMQEPFTEQLAQALGAKVTTVGTHSGVKITCSA